MVLLSLSISLSLSFLFFCGSDPLHRKRVLCKRHFKKQEDDSEFLIGGAKAQENENKSDY